MIKLLKIITRAISITFEWTFILFLVFAFMIRSPYFQTFFAKQATAFLSSELDTKFEIGKVSIIFFDEVALNDVLVIDKNKDTLAYIHELFISIDGLPLNQDLIQIEEVQLEKVTVKLNRDKTTGAYNYAFIEDYFDSGKSTSKKTKPPKIIIKELDLRDIRFQYSDNRKGHNTYGMDYDYLDFKNVNLFAQNITIEDGVITAAIRKLQAEEKCGIKLQEFSTLAKVFDGGLRLKNLQFKTERSIVSIPKFKFIMRTLNDFNDFEDQVRMDCDVAESKVNLQDITYFAPVLKGLNQDVYISAEVREYVKNLQINQLDLKTGKGTLIKGDINLPDFRDLDASSFVEKINYARIDLQDVEALNLPERTGQRHIVLDEHLKRLKYVTLKNSYIKGDVNSFVASFPTIETNVGQLSVLQPIQSHYLSESNQYEFKQRTDSLPFIRIDQLDLGNLVETKSLGRTSGIISLSAKIGAEDYALENFKGHLNEFEFNHYAYKNIDILDGNLKDENVFGKLSVKDKNAKFNYEGNVDFSEDIRIIASSEIQQIDLGKTHLINDSSLVLKSKLSMDLKGNFKDSLVGNISLYQSELVKNNKQLLIQRFDLFAEQLNQTSNYQVRSDLLDANMEGKINFETILDELLHTYEIIIPGITTNLINSSKIKKNNQFDFDFNLYDVNSFLHLFEPNLFIAPNTYLNGTFSSKKRDFNLDLECPKISYQNMFLQELQIHQKISRDESFTSLKSNHAQLNDSINVDQLNVLIEGDEDVLLSDVTWNPGTANNTHLSWETAVLGPKNFKIKTLKSHLSLKEIKWDIAPESTIEFKPNQLDIAHFSMRNKQQSITANGRLTENRKDKMNFDLVEINLHELSQFLGLQNKLDGNLNGWGQISNPYSDLDFTSDFMVDSLVIDDQLVGDVKLFTDWNEDAKSVILNGDLEYLGQQTFDFEGAYFTKKTSDKLALFLNFNHTDIAVANAFVDEKVLSKIQGKLDGKLAVKGTLEKPELHGELNLSNAGAKVEMFGASYKIDGKIISNENGFMFNHLPLSDEEGNTGSVVGAINHDHFENWNFELNLNLEDNYHYLKKGKKVPLDKFLALNTKYKEDEIYYGKGYVTGDVNLSGYANNLNVEVNLKSKKGTEITIPLYGSKELEEENSFIHFKSNDTSNLSATKKINLTGVNLDLNFDITQDTKLNVIFNDQTGDQINVASGTGAVNIKLNNTGDVEMNGMYKVQKGTYRFVLSPYSKNLTIEPGGSINWTGDPLHAKLDLKAYFPTICSIEDISPDQFSNGKKITHEVRSYVVLNDDLMKPTISFDIQSPNANESERALINRVNSDRDEQNRQFFSLLIWGRFQPLKGSVNSGTNSALDIVNNQINALLNEVSKDYKMNVNMNANNQTGDKTFEFGISKGVLNDRLILSANVGVGVENTNSSSKNNLIGDVSIEYLLNEDGSFRTHVYNKSNQNTVQNANQGMFTQGVGIQYQEDFNDWGHFKMVQYVLDVFRPAGKKRFPNKKKKKETPVPIKNETNPIALPNNEE